MNFPVVTSKVSCIAEIFDFAASDGALVGSSVFVHVFLECGVLLKNSSILTSWMLASSDLEAILGLQLDWSLECFQVRFVRQSIQSFIKTAGSGRARFTESHGP